MQVIDKIAVRYTKKKILMLENKQVIRHTIYVEVKHYV